MKCYDCNTRFLQAVAARRVARKGSSKKTDSSQGHRDDLLVQDFAKFVSKGHVVIVASLWIRGNHAYQRRASLYGFHWQRSDDSFATLVGS